eukprot:Skav215540  [mRNA]  locus=scaffold4176:51834:53695:- [translate_table: standard]
MDVEGEERKRRRKEEGAGQPQGEGSEGEVSEEEWDLVSVAPLPSDQEALEVLRSWIKGEDTGGLSAAQSGALLALCIHRSGTPFGSYLDLMVLALQDLFGSGEYRRLAGTTAAKKKEKAAKVARRTGLLIWHGLVTALLNMMWTGGGKNGAIHRGPVTKAQAKAQERLWESVKVFMDDASETSEKVPKSPALSEWGKKLSDVKISYQGEIIEKAQKLTLDQLRPGLPPDGFGASVALADLVEGELKERLSDPMSNLLREEEMPETLPVPRVHADPAQWELIAADLHRRGLVEPVEDPVKIKGRPLVNGAFGVVKAGKFLDDERPVLRLIMDFRGVNAATRVLTGDVSTLTGAAAIQHAVLPEGKVLRLSADDLVAAFYLFALPPGWSKLMCFNAPVKWRSLGFDKPGEVWVGARVLPMGWASAVGVLQHAHRRLALRPPLNGGAGLLGRCEIRRNAVFPDLADGDGLWSLYLDDTSLIEMMDKKVSEELEGKPSEEQERLCKAYAHWGIPVSLPKAWVRARSGEKLGAVINGDLGQLRAASRRALETMGLAKRGFPEKLCRSSWVERCTRCSFDGRPSRSLITSGRTSEKESLSSGWG